MSFRTEQIDGERLRLYDGTHFRVVPDVCEAGRVFEIERRVDGLRGWMYFDLHRANEVAAKMENERVDEDLKQGEILT